MRGKIGHTWGALLFALALLVSVVMPAPAQAAGSFTKYLYGNGFYYKVYVPSTYTGGAVPLMVMLHGCSQNADDFAAGTGMNALANEKNFIVLYPEMNTALNVNGCWNWFNDSSQHRGTGGEADVIKGMVDAVKSQYSIDNTRVYAAGLSAGGAMSVVMGATYPDVFRAVGVSAGLEYNAADSASAGLTAMRRGGIDPNQAGLHAYNEMGSNKHRTPVIVFHGTSDTTVYPVNATQVITQWAQTNDLMDDGADNNTVNDVADQTLIGTVAGGRSYTQYVYHDQNGLSLIEYYKVTNMGHAWSGGSSAGSYTDPSGPNASRLMWDFFVAH